MMARKDRPQAPKCDVKKSIGPTAPFGLTSYSCKLENKSTQTIYILRSTGNLSIRLELHFKAL